MKIDITCKHKVQYQERRPIIQYHLETVSQMKSSYEKEEVISLSMLVQNEMGDHTRMGVVNKWCGNKEVWL